MASLASFPPLDEFNTLFYNTFTFCLMESTYNKLYDHGSWLGSSTLRVDGNL